ncbi:MAG: glycosyltransferase family 4 protein [Ignavibacteriaceae bacterium]
MKILYSCLSKSWGGMEMFTLTAVKQLLKRNINVELLCLAESRLHIEANNLGLVKHPIKVAGYFHPYGTLKVSTLIRKEKFDIIHTQASKDLWLLVPALNLIKSRIPLFFTKQVGSFIKKKDQLHRLIYHRVTYALAISNIIRKNLIETTTLNPEKILIMPNGIDTGKFDPEIKKGFKIRKEFNIKDDEVIIGMMSRFSPGKGHEEFLSAAKELNKKYKNLKFFVVGEASRGENAYEKKIKKTAGEYNLNNIIFSGFRSDTPEVLAAMDIFVFPSHAEAFGIALVEAMSMGKPSVCSSSDGVLDIAVEKETSLLFEKKNQKDLTNKIEQLINSQELRIYLGNNARQRVVENFDLEILTNKVLDYYKSALK